MNVFQISVFLFLHISASSVEKRASHSDRMTKSIIPLRILHVLCLSFLILPPNRCLACTVIVLPLLHLTWSFCFHEDDLTASHCYISRRHLGFFVVLGDFLQFLKGFREEACSGG